MSKKNIKADAKYRGVPKVVDEISVSSSSSEQEESIIFWATLKKAGKAMTKVYKRVYVEIDAIALMVTYYSNDIHLEIPEEELLVSPRSKNNSKKLSARSHEEAVLLGTFDLNNVSISQNKSKNSFSLKNGKTKSIQFVLETDTEAEKIVNFINKASEFGKGKQEEPLPAWECTGEFCVMPEPDPEVYSGYIAQGETPLDQLSPPQKNMFGVKIRSTVRGEWQNVRSIMGGETTMFVLLRHFGCCVCKKMVFDILGKAQELNKLGINIVCVGNGDMKHAHDFCREMNFPLERLYIDTQLALYKQFSIGKASMVAVKETFMRAENRKHIADLESRFGNVYATPGHGQNWILGGVFVISPQKGIIYQFKSQYMGHQVNLDDLISKVFRFCEEFPELNWRPNVERSWDTLKKLHPPSLFIEEPGFQCEAGRLFENAPRGSPKIFVHDIPYKTGFTTTKVVQKIYINKSTSKGSELPCFIIAINATNSKALIFSHSGSMKVKIPLVPPKNTLAYVQSQITQEKLSCFKIDEDSPNYLAIQNDILALEASFIETNVSCSVVCIQSELFTSLNETSEDYDQFLNTIGNKVELSSWRLFPGKLDCTGSGKTGKYSYFSQFEKRNIMFHVSSLMAPITASRLSGKTKLSDVVMNLPLLPSVPSMSISPTPSMPSTPSSSPLQSVPSMSSSGALLSPSSSTKSRKMSFSSLNKDSSGSDSSSDLRNRTLSKSKVTKSKTTTESTSKIRVSLSNEKLVEPVSVENENENLTRSVSDKLKLKKKSSRSGRDQYMLDASDVNEKKEAKEAKESKESPIARRKSNTSPLAKVSSSESISSLSSKKSSVEQRIHEQIFSNNILIAFLGDNSSVSSQLFTNNICVVIAVKATSPSESLSATEKKDKSNYFVDIIYRSDIPPVPPFSATGQSYVIERDLFRVWLLSKVTNLAIRLRELSFRESTKESHKILKDSISKDCSKILAERLELLYRIYNPNISTENSLMPFIKDTTSFINFSSLKIEKEVAQGAFGVVSRAIYTPNSPNANGEAITVASKSLIFNNMHGHWKLFDEFIGEYNVQVKLKHPNIAALLGLCLDPLLLIFEWLPEGTLYDYIEAHQEMSDTEKNSFSIDIGVALHYLHHECNPPIVHRDLKSPNVLLKREGTIMAAKIGDFGTAMFLPESGFLPNYSAGNPIWSAPEILNRLYYDTKFDVYAFGLVLWELATLARLFESIPLMSEIEQAIMNGQRETLPPNHRWNSLISSLWDQDPNNRPPMTQTLPLLIEVNKSL